MSISTSVQKTTQLYYKVFRALKKIKIDVTNTILRSFPFLTFLKK